MVWNNLQFPILDGLQHTKEWLKRHIDLEGLSLPVTDKIIIRNVTAQTLAKAYLELLEWDSSKSYPEVKNIVNFIFCNFVIGLI